MNKKVYYVVNTTYNNVVNTSCTEDPNKQQCFKYSNHLPIIKNLTIENIPFVVASFNVLFQRNITDNTHIKKIQQDYKGYFGVNFKYLALMPEQVRIDGIMKTIYDLFRLYNVDILGLQEFNINDLPQLRSTLYKICCTVDDLDYIIPNEISNYYSCTKNDEDTLTKAGLNDLQIVVYRKSKLRYNNKMSKVTYYQNRDKNGIVYNKINRRILDISFSIKELLPYNRDQEFRFINTHVYQNQTYVLDQYIYDIPKPTFYTCKQYYVVVVGDMETEKRPVIQYSPGDTSSILGVSGATGTILKTPGVTGIINTGPSGASGPCNQSYYGPTGFMAAIGPESTLPVIGAKSGVTGSCDYGIFTVVSTPGSVGATGAYTAKQPNILSLISGNAIAYNTYAQLSGTPDKNAAFMVPGDKKAEDLRYTTINKDGNAAYYDHIWFRIK